MRLLLDTHTIIWWLLDDPILSQNAREAIQQSDDIYVSAASGWEIATKCRLGKLPEMSGHIDSFMTDVVAQGFKHLPIEARHGLVGGSMDGRHKDPFDRLIAAQALLENMTVVTLDREIAQFGCEILW